MATETNSETNSEKFKNITIGLASVIASILIPLLGLYYSNQQKEKEINKDFLELGIKILSDTPSDKNIALRKWAVDLINTSSTIQIPPEAETVLLDKLPIFSFNDKGISKSALLNIESKGLVLGVLLSKLNDNVNYQLLKERKIQFSYIRLTQGISKKDEFAERHAQQLDSIGVHIGFYHFFVPTDDPKLQAENFIHQLKTIKWQLAPVIDCEEMSSKIPSDYANRVYEFANIIKSKTGVVPIIYVSSKFANEHLDQRFSEFPLFIARYIGSDVPATPELPKFWKKYMFWHIGDHSEDTALENLNVGAYNGEKPL
jgi:lysozyme